MALVWFQEWKRRRDIVRGKTHIHCSSYFNKNFQKDSSGWAHNVIGKYQEIFHRGTANPAWLPVMTTLHSIWFSDMTQRRWLQNNEKIDCGSTMISDVRINDSVIISEVEGIASVDEPLTHGSEGSFFTPVKNVWSPQAWEIDSKVA